MHDVVEFKLSHLEDIFCEGYALCVTVVFMGKQLI